MIIWICLLSVCAVCILACFLRAMCSAEAVISYSGNKANWDIQEHHKALIVTELNVFALTHFSPSISSLLYSISGSPSRLLCIPPPLGDLHFTFPLCINTTILKFLLQSFRPLLTPPEAKKEKKEMRNVPSGDFCPNSKSEGELRSLGYTKP